MFRNSLTLLSLTFLATCGGSSGGYDGPPITPVSESGFATASSVVTGGAAFATPNVTRHLGSEDGIITLDEQDVGLTISQDGQSISLTIAGQPYTLQTQGNGDYVYFDDTSSIFFSRIYSAAPEAEIVYARAIIENELNSSTFVIGFDTDPDTVVAMSGTAERTGEIYLTARNGYALSSFIGPATLDIDFDAMTISGAFTLSGEATGLTDIVTGTSDFVMEETDIIGNGFEGTFDLVEGAVNGIIINPVYSGRFYGSNAETAGGQVSATITVGDDEEPTQVVGAFTAN